MNTSGPNSETGSAPNPRFSVITASYNYGHLVGRAIESVLRQSCRSFEIIVVDDGSTDDTPQVLARYGGAIRHLRQDNAGQSRACNRGVDSARGRFIVVLDADDELLPDALQRFSDAIDRFSSAESEQRIYFGGYVSVSQDGDERERTAGNAPAEPDRRLSAYLRKRIPGIQNCSTAVPRALLRHHRFPEGLRQNTDIVLFGQLLARFPAERVDALIARIHEHPQRTRKQLDRVLDTGLKPVSALFDSAHMPAQLMPLKRVYLGQRLRSIARMLYQERRFADARNLYWRALWHYPPAMAEGNSIKRMLIATLRSIGRRSALQLPDPDSRF